MEVIIIALFGLSLCEIISSSGLEKKAWALKFLGLGIALFASLLKTGEVKSISSVIVALICFKLSIITLYLIKKGVK